MLIHSATFVIISLTIISLTAASYYNHRHSSEFIKRNEWQAAHPNGDPVYLELPVGRIIVAHTVTPKCETQYTCSSRVRSIQNYHMNSKHWRDIGYNFLIGGDGGIYVGRGWNKVGTHTAGHNNNSIGVALIGTFTNAWPSRKQLSALKYLFVKGVHVKKLSPNYIIYPHRALVATASPGDKLVAAIENWSHYYTNFNATKILVRPEEVTKTNTTNK